MANILDNPIFNALVTGNKHLSSGNAHVKYIQRDVGLFAGYDISTATALKELARMLPPGERVILFVPKAIRVTEDWEMLSGRPLLQMVHTKHTSFTADYSNIVPLNDTHIPAMLELTRLTNPGPFFDRTIEFGNYEGIFHGDQLVSMIGQRLHPGHYTEVSAVCTHPDFTGKGLAATLLQHQVDLIRAASGIPFLHLYPENPAYHLYKKLGFRTRRRFMVYLLKRCPFSNQKRMGT